MVPPNLDVGESVQAAQQLGVNEWLHESVALRPAETRVGWGHFGEHSVLGVDETQDLVGHGVRQDPVDQPDRLEGAQRLVVQPDPARIVDERVAFVDHQRPDTLPAKDIGQGQPDRARADHQDVDICIVPGRDHHRPSRKSRCRRLNVLASSYCGQ